MVGDERRVVRLHDRQLVLEALGVGEAEEAVAALSADALLPEVEGVGRGDAPDDAVHHARAGAAGRCVRILEERDVRAGAALLVRVEQVVDRRVVLVHGLLHEPQAERARVVLDVPRRVAGDARDVVHAFELHRAYRTVRDRAGRARRIPRRLGARHLHAGPGQRRLTSGRHAWNAVARSTTKAGSDDREREGRSRVSSVSDLNRAASRFYGRDAGAQARSQTLLRSRRRESDDPLRGRRRNRAASTRASARRQSRHTLLGFVVDDIERGRRRACASAASPSRSTTWATSRRRTGSPRSGADRAALVQGSGRKHPRRRPTAGRRRASAPSRRSSAARAPRPPARSARRSSALRSRPGRCGCP